MRWQQTDIVNYNTGDKTMISEACLYEIRYEENGIPGRCWYTTRKEAATVAEELAYNDNGCEVVLIKEHGLPFQVDDVIELAMWLDDHAAGGWR